MDFNEENIALLFGTEAAEDENFDRLQSYYVKNKTHQKIMANVPLRILVGHKGIGKSAIFEMARHEDEVSNRISVIIRPDDIATIGKENVDFSQLIRDWKEGLIQIIAEKVIEKLELFSDNSNGQTSLKVTGKLLNFIGTLFEKQIQGNINCDPLKKLAINKYQQEHKITIYIDDLDRGWESKKQDIQRISALLNAVRDLCNENKGLQIRISLRSDVYYLVRTSDESTDKIEGYVVWHNWTNNEIFLLLIKRIENFWKRKFNIDSYKSTQQKELSHFLDSIFEKRFEDSGKWENAPTYRVLMSLIRKRPRDLVKLCTLAARNAYDNDDEIIGTQNLKAVFSEYSQGRLQDTVNEYKSELPDIERLLLGMKPSRNEKREGGGYIYDTPGLKQKIRNVMQGGSFSLKNGRIATETDLSQFLYKINFITARKENQDGRIVRYYFEENKYLSHTFVDFGFKWEIHPAFRWALSPDDEMVIRDVDLDDEECL